MAEQPVRGTSQEVFEDRLRQAPRTLAQ